MRLAGKKVLFLSERNIRSLLSKLGREDSARTLVGGDDAPGFIVIAEHDRTHYAKRPPGIVHEADDPGLAA